jgi:PAS domain S-box-containing protein
MLNNSPDRAWTEADRLAALAQYAILDTPPEKAFDDVVQLVSQLLDAPIAAVNFIAEGRQWFKSEIGLGVREMPLDDSICKIAILQEDFMIVPDTRKDIRFDCNPLVTAEPGLRFYAGELLKTPEGLPLGTLCVLDMKPRPEGLTAQQRFALKTLAQQITNQLELRKITNEQQALLLKQKGIEAELRFERDRSQQLLEGMDEGFVLLDFDYRIQRISQGGLRMDGRTEAELIGLTHWEAWPGSEELPVGDVVRRVMVERVSANVEQLYVSRHGRRFWLDVRVYPADGGIAIFYRNMTDRKEAEEALRQADRRKDEFLAMLAHELRNPLAPIASAADLLSIGKIGADQVKQISEIISRQARHMTGLLEDLLDVSRVTRGLVQLDKAAVDIKTIITEAVEQVRPLIEEKSHHLEVHLYSGPALVSGDKKRLVQMLANLINNAAKYTPSGSGHIILRLDANEDQLTLSVRDNGIGMSAELLEQAFELFTQGERTSDRSQGGLGIGLALVKSLTQLHDGMITAESKGLGLGSEFRISLPRLHQRNEQHRTRADRATVSPAKASLRVMVVDDNADAAQVLAMFLEQVGYEVFVEYQASKAIERACQLAPQVCLLDIGMPEIDGYKLARRLRAMPEMAGATLVAVTGYGQQQDIEAALAAGFDRHFVKPVNTKELMGWLAELALAGC